MSKNTSILWGWLASTGRTSDTPPEDGYVVVGVFNNPGSRTKGRDPIREVIVPISALGPNNLTPPQLEIRANALDPVKRYATMNAFVKDVGNGEWLKHEPRIFLFHKRPLRKKKVRLTEGGDPTDKRMAPGWYHPVDIDAATTHAGSGFYAGEAFDADRNPVPGRVTEWDIAGLGSYDKVEIDIDLYSFYIKGAQGQTLLTQADMPFPRAWVTAAGSTPGFPDYVRKRGYNGSRGRGKTALRFRLAIGIKNPNPQPGENPWIFGPMSEEFYYNFNKGGGQINSWTLLFGSKNAIGSVQV